MKDLNATVTCQDGTTLSVQASWSHYCEPRDDFGPYLTVEVGFPSVAPPSSWMEYCENPDRPTNTVYGRVPVALVRQFIAEHGGMVSGELPEMADRVGVA